MFEMIKPHVKLVTMENTRKLGMVFLVFCGNDTCARLLLGTFASDAFGTRFPSHVSRFGYRFLICGMRLRFVIF